MPKFMMDLDSYKTRFTGGARQYLFFVLFQMGGTAPGASPTPAATAKSAMDALKDMVAATLSTFGFGASRDFYPYLVKSTSLPDSTLEEKVIPMQGFNYKYPGDRIFSDWPVTFNLDDKGELLSILRGWQDSMHKITGTNVGTPTYQGVKSSMQTVFLVDYQGNSYAKYEIYHAWPKTIGQVQLDYTANGIATVDVTFTYNYFTYTKEVSTGVQNLIKQGVNTLLGR